MGNALKKRFLHFTLCPLMCRLTAAVQMSLVAPHLREGGEGGGEEQRGLDGREGSRRR